MAEDRKARLKALAAKAGRTKEVPAEAEEERKAITFRNYAPTDKSLDASADNNEDSNEPHAKKAKMDDSKRPIHSKSKTVTARKILR